MPRNVSEAIYVRDVEDRIQAKLMIIWLNWMRWQNVNEMRSERAREQNELKNEEEEFWIKKSEKANEMQHEKIKKTGKSKPT